ncbi:Adenylyl-sulfate kinase 1, chloroplastic [Vitis vinifera]|uniref:Adenylyl-sulfate kinase 1, chloroplastic n=1 Tax=Vitis vinifera TaxID=29760 RepID=A0A438GAC7_VITVI|nr:Adenylyl-sulfate kinase 1, chloroplastic [Vitis vinifera]
MCHLISAFFMGKSSVACALSQSLYSRGKLSYILDGDNVRHGLNRDLSFKAEDRAENIRRVGEVAKLFADAGLICIASLISPYRRDRDACRALVPEGSFIEVEAPPLNEIFMQCSWMCHSKSVKRGTQRVCISLHVQGKFKPPISSPSQCIVTYEPDLEKSELILIGEIANVERIAILISLLEMVMEVCVGQLPMETGGVVSPCIGEDGCDFWNSCFHRCFHDWELEELNNFFKLIHSVTVQGFTGIHDPYEPPLNCEVVLDSRRKHSNTKGWTFSKVYGKEKPSYKSLNDNQYYTPTKAPLPANSNSLKRGQTSLHGSST